MSCNYNQEGLCTNPSATSVVPIQRSEGTGHGYSCLLSFPGWSVAMCSPWKSVWKLQLVQYVVVWRSGHTVVCQCNNIVIWAALNLNWLLEYNSRGWLSPWKPYLLKSYFTCETTWLLWFLPIPSDLVEWACSRSPSEKQCLHAFYLFWHRTLLFSPPLPLFRLPHLVGLLAGLENVGPAFVWVFIREIPLIAFCLICF